ncbi:methyltransferase type 11 [Spirochaetia bacterium]|nr:methyltransferase type 11 [Spirochaetia bacterium]GHU31983.1 methyltransferase type 11 [Spirochaetia bacterium]
MIMQFLRKFKDLGITGGFTRWYDKNTRENRIAEMQGYAKNIASHLKDGAKVLEVAPGPGYLSIELSKLGNYDLTGMDISPDFIEICKANAKTEKANIDFVVGNVSSMTFENDIFDFIMCTAAFKNFKEPIVALKEMYRVLTVGGIAFIGDMNRKVSEKVLEEAARSISKSRFETWFMMNTFKMLKKSAYSREEFERMIKQTPFSRHEIFEDGIGFGIYLYK